VPITVRRPTFDLDDLAHRWVGGSRLGTWFGDAAHVFIPLGEQFFIDAVKEFRVRIHDEELRRDVSAFIGQEAVHSRVHEAVWAQRRDLGVPVDRYAELIQAFQSALDPFVPPKLKLATTAARFAVAIGAEVDRYAAPSFHPADDDPPPQYHAWLTAWHGSGRTD